MHEARSLWGWDGVGSKYKRHGASSMETGEQTARWIVRESEAGQKKI